MTKKTDYSLIALSFLARLPGEGVASARAIAEECGVPVAILTNVLKTLAHAGIVLSERGASGGYRLARSLATISLHEVITVMEGPVQFVRCIKIDDKSNDNTCGLEPSCPVRMPAHRIHRRLKQFLEDLPLSELMEMESDPAPEQQWGLCTDQRIEMTTTTMERSL